MNVDKPGSLTNFRDVKRARSTTDACCGDDNDDDDDDPADNN